VHGVDTRVLPGDPGAFPANQNPIVSPVNLNPNPQKPTTAVKQPRRQARKSKHQRLLNRGNPLINFFL
ncbi:hypothetical protein ACVGXP_00715, partial [Enterobacter hormaechei]